MLQADALQARKEAEILHFEMVQAQQAAGGSDDPEVLKRAEDLKIEYEAANDLAQRKLEEVAKLREAALRLHKAAEDIVENMDEGEST